ncbi:MAG TPA: type II secretion system protein GspG [Candidatus Hydrogenedentes bacterium]|nr:type II secretion system protein GspG [Candidatus Hydrogenedentota bacterium]HRK33809.1 type II secretion system protein GspG [Candidatus Hydrogenedentota bacterium]
MPNQPEQIPVNKSPVSRRRRNGCILTAFFGGFAALSLALGYIIIAISRPEGSPIAQMFRAEAGLAVLVMAVETYKTDLGAYPPSGQEGLLLAMRHVSKNVDYMPQDQALDPWGFPFVYVTRDAYASTASALQNDGAYLSPNTYQLYSIGMDGDAGVDSSYGVNDNISNWDTDKSWRKTYERRHREYFLKRGTVQ